MYDTPSRSPRIKNIYTTRSRPRGVLSERNKQKANFSNVCKITLGYLFKVKKNNLCLKTKSIFLNVTHVEFR